MVDACFMWTKEGGEPLDWDPWDCQKDALSQFQKHRLVIILKTRQLGMSWTACAYTLWKILFTGNFHAYFQSIGQKEVTEQVERIKFIYYNLPEWVHERVQMGGRTAAGRTLKDNDSLVEFSNGSVLHAVATTKRAGHGAAPGLYILDEFARNEQDIMTWRAVKPALAKRGQVIVISTANGVGNVYHQLWMDAESGSNGFEPLFYPASAHPEYTPEFLKEQLEGFAGDLVGYYEAYPETPAQAFQTSSRCPFPSDRIKEMGDWARLQKSAIRIGRLEYDEKNAIEFVHDPRGSLLVFKDPVPGHGYTIGADVADGLTRGDYSAAVVLDPDTDEVVALYRNKIEPEYYAEPLFRLATHYNMAWLAVEVNRNANPIISDLKARYPLLYTRMQRDKIWDEGTPVVGFWTHGTNKNPIIVELRRYFASREHPLWIPFQVVIDEMSTFEEDRQGKLGASPGNHDDTVMALAIAIEASKTAPRRVKRGFRPRHKRLGSKGL